MFISVVRSFARHHASQAVFMVSVHCQTSVFALATGVEVSVTSAQVAGLAQCVGPLFVRADVTSVLQAASRLEHVCAMLDGQEATVRSLFASILA